MITWHNVNAPDLSGVARIQQLGNENLNSATDALMSLAQQRRDLNIQQENDLKKTNTYRLMEEIRTTGNMEDYENLSLNSLLSSVGGNADEGMIYDALLKQDDEIFNKLSRVNELEADELAITGQKLSNDRSRLGIEADRFNFNRTKNQAAKEDANTALDNAASTYGMDLYGNAPAITDREIQDLAKKQGEVLGYSGVKLKQFTDKVVTTTKDMRSIKEDESPFVQLAQATVDSTYANIESQAKAIRDRVYADNTVTPVFDVYADITTTSQATSQAVEQFPEGWLFSSDVGTNLRNNIEETVDRFAADNEIDSVPPQVLAAALKLGEGIAVNEELVGNNKADISELYRSIQKYYDMHQVNEVRKRNRRDADKNYSKAVSQASAKRGEGMLDILKSKGKIDDLTTMIKSY